VSKGMSQALITDRKDIYTVNHSYSLLHAVNA